MNKDYVIAFIILAVSLFFNIVLMVYADTAEDKIYQQELELNCTKSQLQDLNSSILQGTCLPRIKSLEV